MLASPMPDIALATYRIVVLGRQRVGKTCLLVRFFDNYFEERYRETVEDLYARVYSVSGHVIKVEVMDTAGNMEFPAMRKLNIASAQAFILVYALKDPKSLETVMEIFNEIKALRPRDYSTTPIILVGNKNDLLSENEAAKADFLEKWMLKNGADNCNFARIEASAKTGKDVMDIFSKIAKLSHFDIGPSPVPVISRDHTKPSPSIHKRLHSAPRDCNKASDSKGAGATEASEAGLGSGRHRVRACFTRSCGPSPAKNKGSTGNRSPSGSLSQQHSGILARWTSMRFSDFIGSMMGRRFRYKEPEAAPAVKMVRRVRSTNSSGRVVTSRNSLAMKFTRRRSAYVGSPKAFDEVRECYIS